MSQSNQPKTQAPEFKITFSTLMLALLLILPLSYTIVINLRKSEAPVITPANVKASQPATPSSSLDDARKAVSDNPSFETYLALGVVYYNQAKYEDCIAANRRALEYKPASDVAWNNIAASYGSMGKFDEEIEACNKALAINPNNQLAKNNLNWATGEKAKQK